MMPTTNPASLFRDLPKYVSFPLNPRKRFPQGLCWFTDSERSPDRETFIQEFLGASDEELNAFDSTDEAVRILQQSRSFVMPLHIIGDGDDTEGRLVEFGVGRDFSSGEYIYDFRYPLAGLIFIGRADMATLDRVMGNSLTVCVGMRSFPVHPSRIASGEDYSRADAIEPSEDAADLGPWNFAFVTSATEQGLKTKASSLLAGIHGADRLWAAYIRAEKDRVETAVFALVEAGGKKYGEPFLLFDVATPIEKRTDKTPLPLRLGFFWRK